MSSSDVTVPAIGDAVAEVAGSLLTCYDHATGERVELTAAELGEWVARTASMLRDGCGLRASDRVAVLSPPHWQTAAVLLGAWSIGVAVSFRPWATAGLDSVDLSGEGPLDAVFVSRRRLNSWLETVPDARHRFVLDPDTVPAEVPDGYRDFLAEVRRHPPVTPEYWTVRGGAPGSPDGTTYQQWMEIAHGIADRLGLRPGDRLLADVAAHEQPVHWLLAPLAAKASVVLCANLDPAAREDFIAAEGITHVL